MRKYRALEWLMVVIGCFILAFGVSYFLLPYDIVSGGVAGVAVAIQPLIKIEHSIIINILMILTFILGYVFLGKKFAGKTLVSTITYPMFLYLFEILNLPTIQIDPLLASFYGGAVSGIGIGLVFRSESSTGGMDIPAIILHKFTHIPISRWVLIIDSLTIALGVLTHGIEAVLVGFISVMAFTFMLDKVIMVGGLKSKSVYIISEYKEQIQQRIHSELDRGSTVFPAIGGYSKEKKEVLLVVISSSEYPLLTHIVGEIDPKAFMIVQDATEVRGEGFSDKFHN